MPAGSIRIAIVLAVSVWPVARAAAAVDAVDLLVKSGQVPAAMIREHSHSDFYDNPVGRFLDLLAGGAFTDARSLQPEACRAWLVTRQDTAWTGRFRVWDTELDLNTLCAPG